MKKLIIVAILFFYHNIDILGQDKVYNNLLSWWNLNTKFSIDEKSSISTTYSFRRADFVVNWQQSLLRTGYNYKITDLLTITPGYDWVISFPFGKQAIAEVKTEHRFFEQFVLKQQIKKWLLTHRYRFEQRVFDKGNVLKHRFRYKLILSYPISKNEKLALQCFYELFINYGPDIDNHYFDQNWFYGGMKYKYSERFSFSSGFTYQHILKSDNIRIENNPVFMLTLAYKK